MTVNFTTWKGITDGQRYDIPDSEVLDDWADGQLTSNRDDFDTTAYQFEPEDEDKFNPVGTRAEWTIDSGSPSVSENQLQVGSDTEISTGLTLDTDVDMVWEFRARTDSGLGMELQFWAEDSDNFWRVLLHHNNEEISIDKQEGGSTTTIADISIDPSSERLIRVERTEAETTAPDWKLVVGETEDTGSDSFEPTVNDQVVRHAGSGSGEVNSWARFPLTE